MRKKYCGAPTRGWFTKLALGGCFAAMFTGCADGAADDTKPAPESNDAGDSGADRTSTPPTDSGAGGALGGGGQSSMSGGNKPTHADAGTSSASASDAGAGEDAGPRQPPTVSCARQTPIQVGNQQGPYVVNSVVLADMAAPGEYTFRVRDGSDGVVYVFRDGEWIGELKYDPKLLVSRAEAQTLSFAGLFEMKVRGTEEMDLSRLDESVFNGCYTFVVEAIQTIVAGGVYGPYEVVSIEIDPAAPAGTYTFFAESGNAGVVELRRDDAAVDTLMYAWQTTIGADVTFPFVFPGALTMTVGRPMGTSNLFGLAQGLFNGKYQLAVPAAP